MKKKIWAIALCFGIVAVLATACGSSAPAEDTAADDAATEAAATDEAADAEADAVADTASADVAAVDERTVFVDADWVKSVIDGNQPESDNYVIIETSWGTADDSPDYNMGHIPGAIHVDTASVECEPYWNLFDPETLEQNILAQGVDKDTNVIIYGSDVSGTCRVAYAYIYEGVENVKVLNGAIGAWTAAGYETETDANEPVAATDFGCPVPAHPEYWVSLEDAADRLVNDDNFKLVSIRSWEEFIGETSGYTYIDRAGEPEGAVWGHAGSDPYHMEDYTNDDGTYITFDEMQQLWADCDFTIDNDLAFYCGTGWRATIPFLIAYGAGYDNVALYDGGWYQWQMAEENPDLPVQVGDPASDDCQHVTVADLSTDKAAK